MKNKTKIVILALFIAVLPLSTKALTIQEELQQAMTNLGLLQQIQVLLQQVELLKAQLEVMQSTQNTLKVSQDNIMTKVDKVVEQTLPIIAPQLGNIVPTDLTDLVISSPIKEQSTNRFLIDVQLKNYAGIFVPNINSKIIASVTKNGELYKADISANIQGKQTPIKTFMIVLPESGVYDIHFNSEPYNQFKTLQVVVE